MNSAGWQSIEKYSGPNEYFKMDFWITLKYIRKGNLHWKGF